VSHAKVSYLLILHTFDSLSIAAAATDTDDDDDEKQKEGYGKRRIAYM